MSAATSYYCSRCCSFQAVSGSSGGRVAEAEVFLKGVGRRKQKHLAIWPCYTDSSAVWKSAGIFSMHAARGLRIGRRNTLLDGKAKLQSSSPLLDWRSNVRSHRTAGACLAQSNSSLGGEGHEEVFGEVEKGFMLRAVELAGRPVGLTAPHPLAGCVAVREGRVVGEGFLYAQGTPSAEVQALAMAGESARGSTVYVNLEPGDCHGDDSAVRSLVEAGVARVVVGMQHPLSHSRGRAISELRESGAVVEVLGEDLVSSYAEEARQACLLANEALLFRAAYRMPFSVLKYAMTLDGKIACSSGHAAWVTSKDARQRVFELRARSDAIVVGGNTVRRDNPRLTTRREGGHLPVRIVMSRTLRLPEDANLWDVSSAPTIVMTQRGTREDFQAQLARRGVEIVQFAFLTPTAVMDYCYQRGFLQILWECGGTLSAPAITGGVIHKVMAFVAPKIIGGIAAPSPVGELGFVQMTQAVNLSDVTFRQVGPDMQIDGYLQPFPVPQSPAPSPSYSLLGTGHSAVATSSRDGSSTAGTASPAPSGGANLPPVISFYKTWDAYGALSNFTAHPIVAQDGGEGEEHTWQSVEHFYQAQKFWGVTSVEAKAAVEAIKSAESPEEAARIGRRLAVQRPDLLRADWDALKVPVMYTALRRKFSQHQHLSELLLSTGQAVLVESSPHDTFWGSGRGGVGSNHLGRLLMRLRAEIHKGNDEKRSRDHENVNNLRV